MRFRNRTDAGRKLAALLVRYKGQRPLVLALPRGGVPVAAQVAEALDAPLDLILVRKIGAPQQPEIALGAVVDGGQPIVVHNRDVERAARTTPVEFNAICNRELAEIERRRRSLLGNRAPLSPTGRTAIVVDDGIATGATMRAALRATRMRNPKQLVLAVPVAPARVMADLQSEVDDVVCLTDLDPFGAVGYFYDDFHQLSDADVIDVLKRFPAGADRAGVVVGEG